MVIGRCQRSDDIVEPRLKDQWFIDVTPMAERAMKAVRDGRTRFVPPRFEKVFFDWMENIHDWNLSRQLWWGHRIPAWYCPDGHVTVSDDRDGPSRCVHLRLARARPGRPTRSTPGSRAACGRSPRSAGRTTTVDLRDLLPDDRDGDRLRHPLLLGRPDDDARRVAHRPGAVLGRLPLRARARPVRPQDVEDEGQRHRPARGHGRDRCRRPALRARQRRGAGRRPATRPVAPRRGPQLREQDLERRALRPRGTTRGLPGRRHPRACPSAELMGPAEHWILVRCADAEREADEAYGSFQFAEATRVLHAAHLVRVLRLVSRDGEDAPGAERAARATRVATWQVLAWVLDRYLRLLHPVMPHITEEIWGRLPHRPDDRDLLIVAPLARCRAPGGRGCRRRPTRWPTILELVTQVANARADAGHRSGHLAGSGALVR